jgi:hypothetical protein
VVVFAVPRVECPACELVRQVEICFADVRWSYTKSFERCGLELSRKVMLRDNSRDLG